MKMNIATTFTAAGILISPLAAQPFAGADAFTGSEKDETLWAPDVLVGNAALVQQAGRVYHTVVPFPAGVSDDIALWYWNGQAPVTTSWSVQLDVHVPVPIAPLGLYENKAQRYGLGLAVVKDRADPLSAYISSTVTARNSGGESLHEFGSEYIHAASGTYFPVTFPCDVPLSTIRIRWDAATETLSSEFDPDGPIGGYQWTTLQSIPGNQWEMTGSDTFSVFMSGASFGVTLTEGHELYGDNFLATTGGPVTIEVGMRFATELFWTAPVNTMQQLQSSENAEDWENVGLPFLGDGQAASVFDSSPMADVKFYRVVAE